jgi:hypothetical protein
MSKQAAFKLPTGLARHVSLLGLAGRVAKITGQSQSTCYKRLRRQLLAWLSQDIAAGTEPWMYRTSGGARNLAWRINLTKLRALHPSFFEDPSPRELEDRVETLEAQVVELEWARDTLATELGKVRGEVAIMRRVSG